LLPCIVAPYSAISPSCGVKFYLLDVIAIAEIRIDDSQCILICPYETYTGPCHTQSIATPPSLFGGYIIIHHCLANTLINFDAATTTLAHRRTRHNLIRNVRMTAAPNTCLFDGGMRYLQNSVVIENQTEPYTAVA
jgi:hypothetical protein